MTVDFSRWAVVAFNDDTGLGRMAQDIKSVLGVRQVVIPSDRLATKPLAPGDVLLGPESTESEIVSILTALQGLILLERIDWHPQLLPLCQRMGLKVAAVPMWEWFRGSDSNWSLVDMILCPSEFCRNVVQSYGWKRAQKLTWALDLARFPARQVQGPARIFFHNAGLVDHDDRKGTRDCILAFRHLARHDVRLIVRMQKDAPLPPLDDRIEVRVGNLDCPASLYANGDVAVQPSKMEGLGFMVLEPVCCGVPTITTDYPPMNDHVVQPQLRVRKRWFKRSCFPARAARIEHAHLRLPCRRDLTRRMLWCAEHDLTNASLENRRHAELLFNRARLRDEWSQTLGCLL